MALQEKFIVCGASLTALGMVLKFIAGPAAMAIGSIAVGLHGDVLRVAIIQVIILNCIFITVWVFLFIRQKKAKDMEYSVLF